MGDAPKVYPNQVMDRIVEMLGDYLIRTKRSPSDDGMALLMDSYTWHAIVKTSYEKNWPVDTDAKKICGLVVFRCAEMAPNMVFMVMSDSHPDLKPTIAKKKPGTVSFDIKTDVNIPKDNIYISPEPTSPPLTGITAGGGGGTWVMTGTATANWGNGGKYSNILPDALGVSNKIPSKLDQEMFWASVQPLGAKTVCWLDNGFVEVSVKTGGVLKGPPGEIYKHLKNIAPKVHPNVPGDDFCMESPTATGDFWTKYHEGVKAHETAMKEESHANWEPATKKGSDALVEAIKAKKVEIAKKMDALAKSDEAIQKVMAESNEKLATQHTWLQGDLPSVISPPTQWDYSFSNGYDKYQSQGLYQQQQVNWTDDPWTHIPKGEWQIGTSAKVPHGFVTLKNPDDIQITNDDANLADDLFTDEIYEEGDDHEW